eukprot:m.160031 g.160031  ORF g.160031 m.160031 type:complete len:868 (-) comp9845_c0_seq5:165-2768(-)
MSLAEHIAVAVRVRPLSAAETSTCCSACVEAADAHRLVLGGKRSFAFDHVFPPETSQADVFQTCVEPLIAGLLEGYNATVFAYGQTGAGKTFTMGSSLDVPVNSLGVTPRALQFLFQLIDARHEELAVAVVVTYLEIYLEDVVDLLAPRAVTITIREDGAGNTGVIGAHQQRVSSVADIMECLRIGARARRTASTLMNASSSRSHSILSVTTTCAPRKGGPGRVGTIHFVDLAGSERAKQTQHVGTRLKEAAHINGGLLALANVINALSEGRRSHVPYRDSKLTRLLKDSLGGNSRTVMICCVSPADTNFEETLSTLKYASRVRSIKNTVHANAIETDPSKLKMELVQLREQLERERTYHLDDGAIAARFHELRAAVLQLLPLLETVLDGDQLATLRQLASLPEQEASVDSPPAHAASAPGPLMATRVLVPAGRPPPPAEDGAVSDDSLGATAASADIEELRARCAALETALAAAQETLRRDETILEDKMARIRELEAAVQAVVAEQAGAAAGEPEPEPVMSATTILGLPDKIDVRQSVQVRAAMERAVRSRGQVLASRLEDADEVQWQSSGSDDEGPARAAVHVTVAEDARSPDGEHAHLAFVDKYREEEVENRMRAAHLTASIRDKSRLLARRHSLTHAQDALQIAKLRRSQALTADVLRISQKIDRLELQHDETVAAAREHLLKKQRAMQRLLESGHVLTEEEEFQLADIADQVATIDATLEFRDSSIADQQSTPAKPASSKLRTRLAMLSEADVRAAAMKLFDEAVAAAVVIEQGRRDRAALEVQIADLTETVRRHEESAADVESLQKELYFYKKTSRDLRRRLRDALHHTGSAAPDDEDRESVASHTTSRAEADRAPANPWA